MKEKVHTVLECGLEQFKRYTNVYLITYFDHCTEFAGIQVASLTYGYL